MNTLKYIMADEGEFDDDNNDIDDDIEEQGEEYSDEEVEETELKKEEEEPCDYEVYDDISQESSLTTHNSDIHTSKHLNKYEMARVLGIRTEMLNRGAPPMIDIGDCINTFEIDIGKMYLIRYSPVVIIDNTAIAINKILFILISFITFAVELTVQILSLNFPKMKGNNATNVKRPDIII